MAITAMLFFFVTLMDVALGESTRLNIAVFHHREQLT